ncbi:hypothetical protein FA09DRAFT_336705 [Tilletiopsis washingtonensis]|uniref:Pentacotripeptide-repeat region of PRORP domain-containing protein n=1 Tax=Tilletiopsis washingtonensis TaxID=58919 RepID=A0A316ZHS8_9BASI|nr:hypothetical protein FA09DRAFT_336705 [Tilletiopsis washingtonensis]PWO00585.1 hypothetical protein FA09DRAFT_336705 [Tilletiopsis washingtonensis]
MTALRRSCAALAARSSGSVGGSALPPLFLAPCLERPRAPPPPPQQRRAASSSSAPLRTADATNKLGLRNFFDSLWPSDRDAGDGAAATSGKKKRMKKDNPTTWNIHKTQSQFRIAARKGDADRLLALYPRLAAEAFSHAWLTLEPHEIWTAATVLLRPARPHWRSEALVAPTTTRRERLQQSLMLQQARMAVRLLRDAPTLWDAPHDGQSLALLLSALTTVASDASLAHLLHLRERLMEEYPDAGPPADLGAVVLRAACSTDDAKGLRKLLELRPAWVQADSAKWQARALQLLLRFGEADFALEHAAAPASEGGLLGVLPLARADSQSLTALVASASRAGLADRSLVRDAATELHRRIAEDRSASDQTWHALILHASLKQDGGAAEVEALVALMDRLKTTRPRTDISLFALLLHTHSKALHAAADGSEDDILQLFNKVEAISGKAPDSDAFAVGVRALLGSITPLCEGGAPVAKTETAPMVMLGPHHHDRDRAAPPPSQVSSPEQRYEATALYIRYLATGGKAHPDVTGPLVHAWADAFLPDPSRALMYLDELRTESVDDVPTQLYVQVLEACERASDWANARKVLQRMHADRVILTQNERKLASSAGMLAAPHPETALEVYKTLRDLPRLPGQAPYTAAHWRNLFSLYSRICVTFAPPVTTDFHVPAPAALDFLRDILRAGYELDAPLLTSLLSLCSAAGKHYSKVGGIHRDEARERMAEVAATVHQIDELILLRSRDAQPNVALVSALMDAYNCITEHERVFEIWYRLLAFRVPLQGSVLSVVLDTCGYAQRYKEGLEVWQVGSRSVGLSHINANCWLSYVEFLVRCGHLRAAIDVTFGEMRQALLDHPSMGKEAVEGIYEPAVAMLFRFTLYRREAGQGDEELQHISQRIRNEAPWLSHVLRMTVPRLSD